MRLLAVVGPVLAQNFDPDDFSSFDGDIDGDRLLPTGNQDEYYYSPPELSDTFIDYDDESVLENTPITNDAILLEIEKYQIKHNMSSKNPVLNGFMARSGPGLRMTGSLGVINNPDARKDGKADSGIVNARSEVDEGVILDKFESSTGCPDLFEDYTEHIDFYDQVPIYGVGMRRFTPTKFDLDSGLSYSPDTHAACSGISAKHGSLCILECPGNPGKALKRMTKNRRMKFSFNPARHEQFRCVCSRDEINNEVCFWSPEEKLWQNPRTCDVRKPFERFHFRMGVITNSWKRILYRKRRRQKPVKIGEEPWPLNDDAWEKAVEYRNSMMKKKTNYENEVIDEGEKFKKPYSNIKDIENLLIDDDIYQNTLDDLAIYEGADDGFLMEEDNWTTWQKAKAQKTMHLLHLLGYFILARESGRNFKPSNFLQYGCYCNEHTPHAQNQGKGVAKDSIDQICHNMAQCRHCANIEVGDKCHSLRPYNFRVSYNEDNGLAKMECLDKPGTEIGDCRANLCQCDKALVEGITTIAHQASYNYNLSGTWGQFSKEVECKNGNDGKNKKKLKPVSADRGQVEVEDEDQRPCHFTENGCRAPDTCCGLEYPYKKPFWSNEGQRKCCGNEIYNSNTHQCCFDKSVKYGNQVC